MPWARFTKNWDYRASKKAQTMTAYRKGNELLVSEKVLEAAKAAGVAEEMDRNEARAKKAADKDEKKA